MSPTQVIKPRDDTDPEQTNVPALQQVLDHVTANIDAWRQSDYAWINNGVDVLTEKHLEAGVYHDFVLEPETVAYIRERRTDGLHSSLPVGTCGTAFCVAGDLVVQNGWTFVVNAYSYGASRVVPTPMINRYIRGEFDIDDDDNNVERESDHVAREILNISGLDARRMFAPNNSIFDIWAIGVVVSGNRLTLPDALPEVRRDDGGDVDDGEVGALVTPAVTSPAEVRDAINTAIAGLAIDYGDDTFARHVDMDALRALITDRARDDDTGPWERYGQFAGRRFSYRYGTERLFTFLEAAQS